MQLPPATPRHRAADVLRHLSRAWLCLLLGLGGGAHAQPPTADATPAREARLRWWREARFGLFIHWGPVSLKGTEISWSRANSNPRCPNKGEIPVAVYDQLYRDFNPTNFVATQWVDLAKSAGMNYLVLTAKHCDGFLLWHSQASDYNMSATPFRRDICRELTDAARRRHVKIGWYFSPMDWRDPDFRTERNDRFLARMQLEVQELLSHYGRIDVMWFDWDGLEPRYDQPDTYRLVRSLQPDIVINNRLDLGKENSNRQILSPEADYYTPEQELGSYDDQRPWETCLTLGTQWAWKPHDQIKSTGEVVKTLARCAGGDGNLLLNVGPMPDGRVEPRQVEVLRGVGAWLRRYGASIYGTRGGPFKPGTYGTSTRCGDRVYLHVLQWPDGPLKLPPIPARIKRVQVLTGGKARVSQTESALEIVPEQIDRRAPGTVLVLHLDRAASSLLPVEVPKP